MVHLASTRVEDDGLAIVFSSLSADLGEEGGEAVVVVLGPAVERVVVALGALDPHAHEHLGHTLGEGEGLGGCLVEVGGRVLERPSAGSQQLLHHLVHGHVLGKPLHQPVVVEEHGFVADGDGRADLEELGPLVHPDLRELLALEQLVNQLGPLGRISGIHEPVVLLDGRRQSDDVECRAAEERGVVADA